MSTKRKLSTEEADAIALRTSDAYSADRTDNELGFSLMCGLHLRGWQRHGSEGYHVETYTAERARELEAQVKAFEAVHSQGE